VRALDAVLSPQASRIKRGEHSFSEAAELEGLLQDAGFASISVHAVEQTIVFPSVLDYVRFQLLAAPMAALLKDTADDDRRAIISSVAAQMMALATSAMLEGDRYTFEQEAFVATGTR
jgi:hypothetical protein